MKFKQFSGLVLLLMFFLAGCTGQATPSTSIRISIIADRVEKTVEVSAGTTIQRAVEQAGISLSPLDQLNPPGYTVISAPTIVQVKRIREEFEVETESIPFERQTMRNESLPQGQTMLIQSGVNGSQQTTYRRVFQDEVEISHAVFKTEILSEPVAEIMMVGVQSPFSTIPINGRIAYLTAGNAWVMEESTGNRRPILTSGDLDGIIFALSPNGAWLLYTRKVKDVDEINSLWMVNILQKPTQPVSLRVNNIVHFAAWAPGEQLKIAYSTAEARPTALGWQANNDLTIVTYSSDGIISGEKQVIDTSFGGVYGWWGTDFAFSPDGSRLAYARTDSVGLIDLASGQAIPLLDILPLQTNSNWAWLPPLAWAPDQGVLYSVTHAPQPGFEASESSPLFDLSGIILDNGPAISLAAQTGMFAYPSPSPEVPGKPFKLAYLQAVFPEQSKDSPYNLVVADRDGSNRKELYPPQGSPGIQPQRVAWSPLESAQDEQWIALVYQGNLVLIKADNGQYQQITGDGSISRIDWK